MKSLGVGQGNFIQVNSFPCCLLNQGQGIGYNRQVAQPEKIHLEQPDGFDIAHGKHGRYFTPG